MPVNVVCVGLGPSNAPINVVLNSPVTVRHFKKRLSSKTNAFYLCSSGEPLRDCDVIGDGPDYSTSVVTVYHKLIGGKGGFGSLIRATGSHINKSSDKSACRDISGRRMRDIKAEKKIAKWMEGESDRKRERAEKKIRKLKKLTQEPHHKFDDSSYIDQMRSTEEGMVDSLKQGLAASKTTETNGGPLKKPKLWIEDLDNEESEDDVSPSSDEMGYSTFSHTTELDEPSTAQATDEPLPTTVDHLSVDDVSVDDVSVGNVTVDDVTVDDVSVDNVTVDNVTVDDVSVDDVSVDDVSVGNVTVDDVTVDDVSVDNVTDIPDTPKEEASLDLSKYSTETELLDVGGDRLKSALLQLGLKCGGTPLERAQRLFSTKGKTIDQLDPSLFAKTRKRKRL